MHTGAHGSSNTYILMEEIYDYLRDELEVKEGSSGSGKRKGRKYGGEGAKGTAARDQRSDRARYIAGTFKESKERAAEEPIKPVEIKKFTSDEEAELKKTLSAFQTPVKNPQTGALAVTKVDNLKETKHQRSVSFSEEPTMNSTKTTKTEDTAASTSADVPSALPPRANQKETLGSDESSQASSQKSKGPSTSQTIPQPASSAASQNITTKENTQESDFKTVQGKARKQLTQKLVKRLALDGTSSSVTDSLSKLSLECMRAILKSSSPQSTATQPQDTPTDSTTGQTDKSSTKTRRNSKKKSGNASSESTSTTENSQNSSKTAGGGSKRD